MNMRVASAVLCGLLVGACGGSESTTAGAGGGGHSATSGSGGAATSTAWSGGGGGAGGHGGDAGCTTATPADGHWDAPTTTFTLSCPNADGECYYPDVTKISGVDWATLERLYLPGGDYRLINLGNLPQRDPKKPLIITNKDGQVRVSGDGGYAVAINGGSGWVFTGRYDPVAKTGDAGYSGHKGGAYQGSRGKYGIDVRWSPDSEIDPPLVAVSGGAHDFELEFLEIHSGNFSGITIVKNDDTAPMYNIKLHDLYIHDMYSEGFYIGSTRSPVSKQHEVRDLEIYNNRVVRTGTEMLQVGEMGGGVRVHHNVFYMGALAYRAPFSGDGQENTAQLMARRGKSRVDHNVVIGGAHSNFIILGSALAAEAPPVDPALLPQEGDELSIDNNFISSSRWRGIYFAPRGDAVIRTKFVDNFFRGHAQVYEIDDRAQQPSVYLQMEWGFGSGATTSPVDVVGNTYDGPQQFIRNIDLNGVDGSVTAKDNQKVAFPEISFVKGGLPAGVDPLLLTRWAPNYRYGSLDKQAIPYAAGDYVVAEDEHIYRAKVATTDPTDPRDNAAVWEDLGLPDDDFRQRCDSPYAGIGLLDHAP